MTLASLEMVLLVVIPKTKAIINMTIYKRITIMALSPPISSPVN